MYVGLHVKYSLFMLDFNQTWILSTDIRNIHISNFMETRPLEA